jgi:hypothetical protein
MSMVATDHEIRNWGASARSSNRNDIAGLPKARFQNANCRPWAALSTDPGDGPPHLVTPWMVLFSNGLAPFRMQG